VADLATYSVGSIVPALAKNARAGHPQLWFYPPDQKPGPPAKNCNYSAHGVRCLLDIIARGGFQRGNPQREVVTSRAPDGLHPPDCIGTAIFKDSDLF